MYVVEPHQLANVWPEVREWIESALAHGQGDENSTDVLVALARGVYVLWYEPKKFCVVFQIVRQPRQVVGTVLYCGGSDLSLIRESFQQGCAWARANGVDVVRVWGREGWEKVLGMERVGVILQRPA